MELKIIKKLYGYKKFLIFIVLVFLAGFFIGKKFHYDNESMKEKSQQENLIWTCSMHPQIRLPKPGKCPICSMDLIPAGAESDKTAIDLPHLVLSENALEIMEIQTAEVQRKFVKIPIQMFGTIEYDERMLKSISAWVPGRIDRLFVDFIGTEVIKGDHMVMLYSPELITAQTEYLESIKSFKSISEQTSELIKKTKISTLNSAREKLILLGLTDSQIQHLRDNQKVLDFITINAPTGGIVVNKYVKQGDYIQTGSPIYTVADISKLWVFFDAYESDISLIRFNQDIEFTVDAYPGEIFKGKITFIPPIIDKNTRTFKVRANVDNKNGRLKPGMFVRGKMYATLSEQGVISDPNLANKFICPMHPSVIKDNLSTCDICGMNLVSIESRGLADFQTFNSPPLVVPVSAVLTTGKRALVYVKEDNNKKSIFTGRQIILGHKAGDYYIVKEGLSEGEKVVVRGNFKIDSALQIDGQSSMMNYQNTQFSKDKNIQKFCPVMGGKINEKYYIEYQGKKVYFCCPGCDKEFLKDPQKYISKLPQFKKEN